MLSEQAKKLIEEHNALVARPNAPAGDYNGIYQRWENPVLTRAHVPPAWRFDLDAGTNPLCLERLGVNAVFNSGAIYLNGKYWLTPRVEGNDRKSFFALAASDSPTEGFRFVSLIELPDTQPEETNVYDMRLTWHEDGWIYGLFCSESKDPNDPDPSAAMAACGIVRTKDLQTWERLPNLKASSQQRNVALFPEFVEGKYAEGMYALLTRPQDGFVDAGSGGGIGYALCADIENAEITEEIIISPRVYHTITEAKNGAGAPPIKTEKGWLHIAHGVRNTAAGLRYVLYLFVTDLDEPWRVVAAPSGYLLAPLGDERVGDVSNVAFCNGAAVNGDDIAIYYASSDTRLHVATTKISTLLDYAFNSPADPGRSPDCVAQRKALIDRNRALIEYERWLENLPENDMWRAALESLAGDEKMRTDAFYKNLAFGTGGLRAVIGAGSNRMNHYVVGRATRGLANYIKKIYPGENLKACIAYDTRYCSKEFAEHCAKILSACGIKVYLFANARPTPMLSFAVRHFKAHTGIVITASHNPRQDNGYKAYGATGGQLTDEAAEEVLAEINALDYFDPLPANGSPGEIVELDGSFDKLYYQASEPFLLRKDLSRERGGSLKLLYTPLHGAGLTPVTDLLARLGYTNLHIVESQKYQDEAHSFPTVQKPNPEEPAVFEQALKIAKELQPDVIFATDPDADRIGVLARNNTGKYILFSGTQMGALLCDYVIQSYKENGGLPRNPGVVTTVVTGTLAQRVCEHPDNNVRVELVLTGFKYIGEKMDAWLADNRHSFIFGFEESYGYLAGGACRDKDAVLTSALVAEMALYYKKKGSSLCEALQGLYAKYGPVSEDTLNVEAKGAAGAARISGWMMNIRKNYASILKDESVVKIEDYATGVNGLPPSNVVKLYLADGSWLVVRPSGTEPKIKLYVCTDKAFGPGTSLEDSAKRCAEIKEKAKRFFE